MKSYDVCECGAPLRLMERPTPKPDRDRGLAQGHRRRRLPQRSAYLGRLLRSRRRQAAEARRSGRETAADHGPRECRRSRRRRVPDAKGVKIGDRRLVHPWLGCGECAVCRRGDEQLCRTPFSIGVFRSGGYADHLLVPHPRYLFDIGNIAPERAAPLACSGITTYGALKKVGPLLQEEPVVIIGAGGLGLMCLALHKAMGGKGAIVVDIDPVKREAAQKAGAQADDRWQRAGCRQADHRGDQGRRLGGDRSGRRVAHRAACARLLVKGGKLIIVGLFGGDITVPTPSFPLRAMTIQGSYVGSLTEMAELLDLVRRKGRARSAGRHAPACGGQRSAQRTQSRQGHRPAGADAGGMNQNDWRESQEKD